MNSGINNPQGSDSAGERRATFHTRKRAVTYSLLVVVLAVGSTILVVQLRRERSRPPGSVAAEVMEAVTTAPAIASPSPVTPEPARPVPPLDPATRVSAKTYCRQGYHLLHQERRVADAIATFETCLQHYPDYSDAHHGLAQALRNSGDSERALASHNLAIELDPDRHDLYWERGITYLQMTNHQGAITNFEACLERKMDFASAHLGLAMAWREKGDYVEALLHHDEAIKLNPRSSWFYNERARTHQKKGDTSNAEADFAKAREIDRGK
jgi:tetratricopeptide (TPR) repeat protein